MYIRRTQTRNTINGKRYFTHRLVKSERVGNSVKQTTLLNLGRHFAIDQAEWPLLCSRIDELLGNQSSLLAVECSLAVEHEAQHCAAQLLVRQVNVTTPSEVITPSPIKVQSVDVESMELTRPPFRRRRIRRFTRDAASKFFRTT